MRETTEMKEFKEIRFLIHLLPLKNFFLGEVSEERFVEESFFEGEEDERENELFLCPEERERALKFEREEEEEELGFAS